MSSRALAMTSEVDTEVVITNQPKDDSVLLSVPGNTVNEDRYPNDRSPSKPPTDKQHYISATVAV